jgi:hypothetical protein
MSNLPDRRHTGGGFHGVPRPRSRAIPVLDGIRVSWEWLCASPHPVTLDRAALGGLSNGPLPLDEVRARLLDRGCPGSVRDAVWAHLIGRSRVDGPTWTVACAGMALPMLAGVCRTLCGGRGVERDDVASGIVTGFVAALGRVELDRPGLASSLRWAAVRGGHAVLREQRRAPRPVPHDQLVRALFAPTGAVGNAIRDEGQDLTGAEPGPGLGPSGCWESTPPPTPGGHPDLVLAAAVQDGVLSRDEAALIGETRLEATTLAQAAARRGRTVAAVTMQRLRAEMRLVDHLRTHHNTSTDAGGGTSHHTARRDPITDSGSGEVDRAPGTAGRGLPRRPRSVTGHRSRAAAPQAPPCGRKQSPTVGRTRRRRDGSGRGGDGQVTR